MPDSEPKEGAPSYLWVGQEDAQGYAEALGVGWAAPLFSAFDNRVVDVAALCAGPPPVANPFTISDVINRANPAYTEAMNAKLAAFVDASV